MSNVNNIEPGTTNKFFVYSLLTFDRFQVMLYIIYCWFRANVIDKGFHTMA